MTEGLVVNNILETSTDRCDDFELAGVVRFEEKTDPVNLLAEIERVKADCREKEQKFKINYLLNEEEKLDIDEKIRPTTPSLHGGPYTPFDCVVAFLRHDDDRFAHFTTEEKLEYERELCALHLKYESLKAFYGQLKNLEEGK
ncbi:MAG: hypothetical protein WA057_04200 [Candidatus Magasanikiibacteriota bacterium]